MNRSNQGKEGRGVVVAVGERTSIGLGVLAERVSQASTTIGATLLVLAVTASTALAQQAGGGTAPAGGLGAQMNAISSEGTSAGGQAGQAFMYVAALACFCFGGWAIWQSRQPQNRESGHMLKGVAGIVLAGLFATGGVIINKASVTASGGNATINGQPAQVVFGAGGAQ